MLKLSQKKRKALLALAVAAAVLGANNAFAASVHDKAITESNQYGSAMRTYWKEAGVYNAKTHTYTFNEDVTLKPNASDQDFNHWTPMFGGIYIAGNKPVTIDMQGHRLDLALNVDQPKGVNNVRAVSPNAIHVSSADLVINNVKGMELSAKGSFLSAGKLRGIYVAGTNQEGAYGDGKGLASLTINNADGWENAVKFHSSQPQVENAIEVWKNTGSADLKISGMVDLYVGNDSDVITVRGGNSSYDIDKAPTAYIGGGAIKAAMGRAAVVSGGELSINSKLQDGVIVAAEGSRDVQVEGNILVKDQQKDQGILTLGMNTDKSYFKGTIFNDNGAGEAYMLLANGAQWTNERKGDYDYHNSSLNQLVGGEADAKAGNIFQKDSGSLTIDKYSGNTNIFYAHTGNGEAAENYAAGNTVIKGAAKGSVVSMITDNTGVAMDNKDSVANVLNALAGKLTYSNYVNGENNLTGYVKIADGLTASSAALKSGDITFNKEDGKGSYSAGAVKPEAPAVKEYTKTLTGFDLIDEAYADVFKDGVYKFTEDSKITNQYGMDIIENAQIDATGKTLTLVVNNPADQGAGIKVNPSYSLNIKADTVKMELTGEDISSDGLKGVNIAKAGAKLTIDGKLDITANGDNNTIGVYNQGDVVVNGDVKLNIEGNNGGYQYYGATGLYATSAMGSSKGGTITVNGDVDFQGNANGIWANAGGAVVNVNGGGSIVVKEGQDMGYAAIKAENGTVNMNVLKDEAGNVTGAADNAVTIKGNLSLDTGAVNSADVHGTKSEINLGLSTAESSLTGVVQNSFAEGGKKAGDKTFTGDANLWLQNGATWNNEVVDTIIKNPWGGEKWAGSRVTNFTGGESEAKAGNIFQKDNNSLTISNYSGNTNIFYAHTGNGEAAENYAAGDTVIKGAAAGSVVSMITDNTGVAMDNKDSVANVLNALAGKLTYSNYVNGESNLTGYVKIADGLTASSKAMQTGDISFSSKDGKGSLKDGSITPGITYPETQTPESSKLNNAITGDAKADYNYKKNGILKEDGKYIFTQNPSAIEVSEGAAVDVNSKDIEIDTTNALLELKGKDAGINAVDANVNIKGDTNISGEAGIIANNSNVTMAGGSKIIGRGGKAISALGGGKVRIESNLPLYIRGLIYARSGQIYLKGGNSSDIEGDLEASDGGEVDVNLSGDGNVLWGAYRTDENSCVKVYIDEGATWNLTDGEDETKAEGKSLLRMAKGVAAPETGLIVKGGATDKQSGFLNMTNRSKTLDIAHYSGWETIIYNHDGAGDKVTDYKSGNTIISKADKDSGVILSTDNSGINMTDKKAVEAALAALAQKVTYKDHEANAANLTGKVQIAEGLTSSSASQYIGKLHWDANGVGQYDKDSVNWKEIYNGDYETLVMKGVRSAATTSMHSWRDNMQDTYTGADLADEDGIFVKALGGKTSSDVKGVKDDNTYRGVQVGYDKALANGWHAGVAFDYRDGDSDYLLGGKGDNQLYSLGVYGVKNFEDQSYLRVAAKAGRVENEYDVYNEIRTLKLHGDYKANAYGLTMEYGKTFGSEASYFTPKAQLTWSQVGSKDYTAHTPNDSMRIGQDSYSSLVARFGVEAGAKSEKGRVYVGLYGAHEFNGDISASYFAKDGGTKNTSFDGKDTWMEMSIGGSYDLSDNCHIYADFAKDFGGDFERKWKASAGLRFEF